MHAAIPPILVLLGAIILGSLPIDIPLLIKSELSRLFQPEGFKQLDTRGPFPQDAARAQALFRSVNPVMFTTSPAQNWTASSVWSSISGLSPQLCALAPNLTDVCAYDAGASHSTYVRVYPCLLNINLIL